MGNREREHVRRQLLAGTASLHPTHLFLPSLSVLPPLVATIDDNVALE